MELQFLDARNGQKTCSADGRYLHSSFNPQVEAERFVKTLPHSFEPSAIIVIGPCLPYCVQPLKESFPQSKLISVQFDHAYEQFSAEWDESFFITADSPASLIHFKTRLFDLLGEEHLVTTQFVSWNPAEAVWPAEYKLVWEALKDTMEKAQSILTTRNFFNVRWFRNTVRALSSIKRYAVPKMTDKPVIVTASGPSLSNAIPFIKSHRTSFVLIAASSSISTLLSEDIVPDFCISTDGGWYAKRHLRAYQTNSRLKDVPLIISAESAVPAPLYGTVPFVLLSYGDALETILAEKIHAPSVKGLRNGTVSGTAAAFAASLTTDKVYVSGLDLAPGKGFQHAEPNENDVPLFTGQTRTGTIETSQAGSRFSSGSLSLYREWFSSQNDEFTSRIFRLVSENDSLEKLGSIKDIFLETLHVHTSNSTSASGKLFSVTDSTDGNTEFIRSWLSSEKDKLIHNPHDETCRLWYSSLVLKEYVQYLRMSNDERENELSKLAEKAADIIKEVTAHV